MLKWLSGGGGGVTEGHLAPSKHSASTQSLSALDEPQACLFVPNPTLVVAVVVVEEDREGWRERAENSSLRGKN